MVGAEQLDEQGRREAEVRPAVDEHVPVALGHPRAHVRALAQQRDRAQDELAGVERAGVGEQPVVVDVELRELGLARGPRAIGVLGVRQRRCPGGVLGRRDARVLEAVDAVDNVGQQHGGAPADVVAAQVQVVHPVQQQREAIGARHRSEERIDARLGGLLAQQPRAEVADAVDDELLVRPPQRVLDRAAKRRSAARRRRQREDRLRRGMLVRDEPGEALCEHGGLAAPRATEHEQRARPVRDRAGLGGGELRHLPSMPSMSSPENAPAPDWLGACRRAVDGMRHVFVEHPTSRERVIETGTTGEGGDLTLVIDSEAEDAVFAQLDALHAAGARFTAISEERGVVDYGGGDVRVVIDPLDGSLNAKRGMTHFALSIAVADGPTMADVTFAFVYDFGPREEWYALRGEGAWLDERRIVSPPDERRTPGGRLEIVTFESADPRLLAPKIDALGDLVNRLRAMGSIAISLCQLAPTRVDGMFTLRATRSVDVAAAQLIVREAGAFVAFPAFDDPLGAPLDIEPHSPVVAARTPGVARAADRRHPSAGLGARG